MLDPIFDIRFKIAQLRTAVVTHAVVAVCNHLAFLQQFGNGIGQLVLAALAAGNVAQFFKDLRFEDVAPHHGQGRGGIGRCRLFHNVVDQFVVVVDALGADDAVAAGLVARHVLDGQHRSLVFFIGLHHLLERTGLAVDQVVGQQHGKGLVAHQVRGAQHGVAQAQGTGLAHIGAGHTGRGHRLGQLQQFGLAGLLQFHFQLVGLVEVVGDRALGTASDKDHAGDAGFARFFDSVLDERLVHDRQHFLGNGFGGGQKAAAQAGHGEHGSANLLDSHMRFP